MGATCGADARRDLGLHPALHVDQTRGCAILYHAATALARGREWTRYKCQRNDIVISLLCQASFFVATIQSDCLLLCACAVFVAHSRPYLQRKTPIEGTIDFPDCPSTSIDTIWLCYSARVVNAVMKSMMFVL